MAVLEKNLEKGTVLTNYETVSERELDYWLLKNTNLMEKLTIEEPSCWFELDTPG